MMDHDAAVKLTQQVLAYYAEEVAAGATVTTEMIEAARAAKFDRSKKRPAKEN